MRKLDCGGVQEIVQITAFIDNQQQFYMIIIQICIAVVEMGGNLIRR
jgi:hypothetical protein